MTDSDKLEIRKKLKLTNVAKEWLRIEHSEGNVQSLVNLIKEFTEPREKRIAELEQEITELKSRDCWQSCEYANPKAELIGQHIKDVQYLTKAKEIIRKLLHYLHCQVWIADKPIMQKDIAEAEQFLKGTEEK